MPQYSGSYSAPRLDLGQALESFPLQQELIGLQVLPVFPTTKKTGIYTAITRASITRPRNVKRAPKSAYNRDDHELSEISFTCSEYGHEQPIDDTERALYATDYIADETAAQLAHGILLLEQEKRIATALFNTTTFTGTPLYTDNSGSAWSTAGTNIVNQARLAVEIIIKNCGMRPNTMVIGYEQIKNLDLNTDFKDRLKYTNPLLGGTIESLLSSIFQIPRVLIGRAVSGAQAEGAASSTGFVWSSSYAWFGVCAGGQNLSEPCIGHTMAWENDGGQLSVDQYREDQTRTDIFRVRQHTQELVQDAYFGHLMKIG